MTRTIEIGTHRVPITAQAWPRLKHLIPKELSAAELEQLSADGDENAEGPSDLATQLAMIGGKAYRLLVILAPAVGDAMPEHEWHGYASEEAMARDEYDDEAAAKGPSLAQIVDAFDVALEINGMKKLGQLLSLASSTQGLLGSVGGGAATPPANGRPLTPTSST